MIGEAVEEEGVMVGVVTEEIGRKITIIISRGETDVIVIERGEVVVVEADTRDMMSSEKQQQVRLVREDLKNKQ